MPGYVYRGSQPLVPVVEPVRTVRVAVPASLRKPTPRKPIRCGTIPGYKRHLKRGETTCPPCRKAATAKRRTYYQPRPKAPLQPCGTVAAYARHFANNETPCDPCKDANRADYHARKKEPQNV